MKNHILSVYGLGLLGVAALFGSVGCTPSAEKLKEVMEKNPDIVFNVIEKHPAKFFEVVRAAQGAAQAQQSGGGQNEKIQAEVKRVLEEIKKPKVPFIEKARVVGNFDAPITIVEYSDYNCGHCGHAHETVKQLRDKYGDKVRFVFKNYPVLDASTGTSMNAARYAEALGLQGIDKAYSFHSTIFSRQPEFHEKKGEFIKEVLKVVAKDTGADISKAEKDMKGAEVKKIIDADMKEATDFGFDGTPAFLVNGASLPGAYPFEAFVQIIDAILAGKS